MRDTCLIAVDLQYDFMSGGALAVPRLLVSNFINFFAAARAMGVFVDSALTGRKIVWDKTAHTFPGGHPPKIDITPSPPAAPAASAVPASAQQG